MNREEFVDKVKAGVSDSVSAEGGVDPVVLCAFPNKSVIIAVGLDMEQKMFSSTIVRQVRCGCPMVAMVCEAWVGTGPVKKGGPIPDIEHSDDASEIIIAHFFFGLEHHTESASLVRISDRAAFLGTWERFDGVVEEIFLRVPAEWN